MFGFEWDLGNSHLDASPLLIRIDAIEIHQAGVAAHRGLHRGVPSNQTQALMLLRQGGIILPRRGFPI